jgi:hypothetical protein
MPPANDMTQASDHQATDSGMKGAANSRHDAATQCDMTIARLRAANAMKDLTAKLYCRL